MLQHDNENALDVESAIIASSATKKVSPSLARSTGKAPCPKCGFHRNIACMRAAITMPADPGGKRHPLLVPRPGPEVASIHPVHSAT